MESKTVLCKLQTNEQNYQRSSVARAAAEISTAMTPANVESGTTILSTSSQEITTPLSHDRRRKTRQRLSTAISPPVMSKYLLIRMTTQTLVLNVKLPKTVWNKSSARSKSAPSSCRRSPGGVTVSRITCTQGNTTFRRRTNKQQRCAIYHIRRRSVDVIVSSRTQRRASGEE
jgi:hypothetical protein